MEIPSPSLLIVCENSILFLCLAVLLQCFFYLVFLSSLCQLVTLGHSLFYLLGESNSAWDCVGLPYICSRLTKNSSFETLLYLLDILPNFLDTTRWDTSGFTRNYSRFTWYSPTSSTLFKSYLKFLRLVLDSFRHIFCTLTDLYLRLLELFWKFYLRRLDTLKTREGSETCFGFWKHSLKTIWDPLSFYLT